MEQSLEALDDKILNDFLQEEADDNLLNNFFEEFEDARLLNNYLDTWEQKSNSISFNKEFNWNVNDFHLDDSTIQDIINTRDFSTVWDYDFINRNELNAEKQDDLSNQQGGKIYSGNPAISEIYNKKWKSIQKKIEFKLKNSEYPSFFEVNNLVNDFFKEIFDDYIAPINNEYYVQYIIDHDTFSHAINSFYMKRKDLSSSIIQNEFDKVFQSRKKIPDNEVQPFHKLKITLNIMPNRIIRGGNNNSQKRGRPKSNASKQPSKRICREKKEIIDMNDYLEQSRFIKIINSDNFCLVRAILIGKAFADKEKNARKLLRKNNRTLNKRVHEIINLLELPNEHLNLTHVKLLERHFLDYQITVYDEMSKGSSILYPNDIAREQSNKEISKFINIVYENNHYNVITSMTAYLGCKYFCEFCRKKYSNLGYHNCNNMCKSCNRINYKCVNEGETQKCKLCGEKCKNTTCLNLHESTQCKKLTLCKKCGYCKSKKHGHVCGFNEKWCLNCKISVNYEHRCFIKKFNSNKKKNKPFAGFVWFDIEAFVNEDNFHEANLIMAKRLCKICLKSNILCNKCIIKYEFCSIKKFVDWVLLKCNNNFIFISHNGKSYDNYFVMRYLQKCKTIKDPNLRAVTDGQKILTFEFRGRIFKDSSLFITRPLESFSKTFGLNELKKGFFPHDFNRRENFNYIGKYPDISYYKPEFFSVDKKKKFEEWYDSVKNNEFDFQKELREYCWSDVELLSQGCREFSNLNLEGSRIDENDNGFDPFEINLTTSSFCNSLYRRNFMPENSIAWIPTNGYNPNENTSKKADQWLKFLSEENNIYIQHAKNGGEKKIGNYFVDGFCEETKKIYEFQGCFYHGCEKCYSDNSFNPVLQEMTLNLKKRTVNKIKFLHEKMPDFEIIEMWEHDWDKMCKENEKVKNFVKNFPIGERLNIRNSLYGGRTNAFKLHYKCQEGEKIFYYDFTSLYPSVQKYGIYPKGHPNIITENFDYKKNYFGIIFCKILPPRGLYAPVLPLKIDSKLIFTLCTACAIEKNMNHRCNHSDEERALVGTWVSLEINKAIEKGYKLLNYYEIYEFKESLSYDFKTKKGGLFTEYVNFNLKEKQEASGYPNHCVNEELKKKYIKDYFDIEGIHLDPSKIIKNNGKREIAKIKLNCLWGYFALNSNKSQFKIITKRSELEDLLNNDEYIVHNIDTKDDEFAQVSFSVKEESCFGGLYTNVIIASFVTAQARLKLYSELEKLDRRVLYFDTDSVFFTFKEGEYMPKLGEFLGEFTNEIDINDGNFITEFVSGGPKNYAYRLDTGKVDCTVKGYPINYLTNLLINFDTIKRVVTENNQEKIIVPQLKFIKDKSEWLIKTEIQNKEYRFVYDKRVLLSDLTTLPFGF